MSDDTPDPTLERIHDAILRATTLEEAQRWGLTLYQLIVASKHGRACPGCGLPEGRVKLAVAALVQVRAATAALPFAENGRLPRRLPRQRRVR